MDIIFPSDFKIRVTSILDNQTPPVEVLPDEIFLIFKIADKSGGEYTAISDPEGDKSINTVINPNDGLLYITVEHYKLKGELYWKIGTKISDNDFKDGDWKWFGEYQPLTDGENNPIVIKNK